MQAVANTAQSVMGDEPSVVEAQYKAREGGGKMKALVWHGNQDVRVEEVPIPDITQADDVVLKVTGTTICGSDLHLYNSEILQLQKGDILGHEFMGVVDRVGPGVKKLKVGQRVVVSFQIACGKCRYCEKKLSSFCDRTNTSSVMQTMYGQRDAGFFGYSHFTGGFPGGQAEYVRVPIGDVNCLPIPDSVTDEQAIYLSDIIPTSYNCVVDTGVEEGDTVGVWGLGPVGLMAVRWAQIKGAKRVIGIDRVPARLEKARTLFGAETIDFSQVKDIPKKLLEMTNGDGLDVALDCGTFHEPKTVAHKIQKTLMLETDSPETINECIVAVRKQGRVGLTSAYAGFANQVNVGALMEKGVRLIGNGQAPVHKWWEECLEYIQKGEFNPYDFITHRVPIDDFSELYSAFQKRIDGVEKVFVETKFSNPPSKGTPQLSRVKDWSNKQ